MLFNYILSTEGIGKSVQIQGGIEIKGNFIKWVPDFKLIRFLALGINEFIQIYMIVQQVLNIVQ